MFYAVYQTVHRKTNQGKNCKTALAKNKQNDTQYNCIKQYSKKRKNEKELENVPENIREIVVCHIVNRHPKLKNSTVKRIKGDIISGNYQVKSFCLTDMASVVSDDPDGGISYCLTFDHTDIYDVRSIVYDKAHIGDTLYIVTTPTDVIKVIRSKTEYFNMFTFTY